MELVYKYNVKIHSFIITFNIHNLWIVLYSGIKCNYQFYFTIPDNFENTANLLFWIDINNRNYSWIDNGMALIPNNNNTASTQADDTGMDLDANEYLFAIDENIDTGTRIYMCIFTPLYLKEPLCQTDAIDKDSLSRVNFDVFNQ